MSEKENSLKTLWTEMRRYLELNIEYARLTAAEKTTILLAAVAMSAIVGVFAVLIIFFISIACVHWLGMVISIALAYTVMACVYVLLLVVAVIFRRQLILNPVAKFISRLFLR